MVILKKAIGIQERSARQRLDSLSKRLLLAVMLSSLLMACATGSDIEISAPQDCARQGGAIQPVCLSQESLCVIPYPDAGLPCRDSDDCAGACLAQTAVNQDEPAVGECERTNAPCGCRTYVEDGRVADAICVD